MRKWSDLMLTELCFPALKFLNGSNYWIKVAFPPVGTTTFVRHLEYGWWFTIVRAFILFGMLNDRTCHHWPKNVFKLSVFTVIERSGRVDFELIRVFVPVQREKTWLILHASQFTLVYKGVKLTSRDFRLLKLQVQWMRRECIGWLSGIVAVGVSFPTSFNIRQLHYY